MNATTSRYRNQTPAAPRTRTNTSARATQPATLPGSGTTLIIKTRSHNLAAVIAKGNAGPIVDVDVKDLYMGEEAPRFDPAPPDCLDKCQTIFMMHEGKYLVLIGQEHVAWQISEKVAKIRGRLISGPALKSCAT